MRAAAIWLGAAVLVTARIGRATPGPGATGGAAPAPPPVAQLAVDLDGDGRPDEVTLGADGVLTIGGQRLALGAPTPAGALRAASLGGRTAIVVELPRGEGRLAIVVSAASGGWRELARTELGGEGLDQDFATALDVTPAGLIRYQTRAGLRRCDGKPAYLFAEGFDPARRVFRPIAPPIGVDPQAPTVAAVLDPAPAAPPQIFAARLASTEPGASDAGALAAPRELDDGRLDTAWREDRGGSGRGQLFTFEARVPSARATTIRITPGDPTSAQALGRGNRPRRLAVVGAEGAAWITLPDPPPRPLGATYVATLPVALTGCVTVILDEVYRGGGDDQTVIAELEVFAEGERAGGGDALLARAVGEDAPGATSAAAALAHRGAAGARALADALAAAGDDGGRRRLVRALTSLHVPEAAAPLAAALRAPWLHGPDVVAVSTALGALGEVAALADAAGRSDLDLDGRIAAARAIGAGTEAGRAALRGLAGAGPRPLRAAVIDALAAAPADALLAALPGASPAAAGDLWHAATLRGRAAPAERGAVVAALAAALPTARGYDVRYRVLAGLAALGGPAELAAVAGALRLRSGGEAATDEAGEAAALRQVVARALGVTPRPAATALLITLADDPDPGVRLAALDGLADAAAAPAAGPWVAGAGPDGVDRVIATALARDAWPELRRRAAVALGGRCARPGPVAALEAAIHADREVAVRGEALAALVGCGAPSAGGLLRTLWADAAAPLELRVRAVDLAGGLGDPALGAALLGQLPRWRADATDGPAALALAAHAPTAIGRLAPPGAAAALLDMLGDGALPELVGAAAAGLGELGPACPPAAAARLRDLAHGDEPTSAVAARRAVGRCGARRDEPGRERLTP